MEDDWISQTEARVRLNMGDISHLQKYIRRGNIGSKQLDSKRDSLGRPMKSFIAISAADIEAYKNLPRDAGNHRIVPNLDHGVRFSEYVPVVPKPDEIQQEILANMGISSSCPMPKSAQVAPRPARVRPKTEKPTRAPLKPVKPAKAEYIPRKEVVQAFVWALDTLDMKAMSAGEIFEVLRRRFDI